MKLKASFALAAGIFLYSCAQQGVPTGGKSDATPPKIMVASPENFSTSFSKNKIQLVFDEYISLKDFNQQIVVSPPLKFPPVATLKGRQLTIEFSDTLRDNTTYTLNFGNSIADVNEGNILADYQFVFSTGNEIDSLSLSGKVENAFNKKTQKGILAALYKEKSDSMPFNRLPSYFAKTNEDGSFTVRNISPGKYFAVALDDKNANYFFNPEAEMIGFTDSSVSDGEKDILLRLFQDKSKLRLVKTTVTEPGIAIMIFNGDASKVKLDLGAYEEKMQLHKRIFSQQNDSITFFYKNLEADSIVALTNDLSGKTDSIIFRLSKREKKSAGKSKYSLSITSQASRSGVQQLDKDLILQFNHPIEKSDFAKIKMSEGAVPVEFISHQFIDEAQTKLSMKMKWNEGKTYNLQILPGAFTDIYSLTNDSSLIVTNTLSLRDYGTVLANVQLQGENKQWLLQLVDENDAVSKEKVITASGVVNFEYVSPAQYKLKLIEDENRDGKWTTGNYLKQIQPEKVFYYAETLNIRSNWDLELTWQVK